MFPPPPSMFANQISCCNLSWLLSPLQPLRVIVSTDVPVAQTIYTTLHRVRNDLPAAAWGTLAWGRLSRDLETAVQVLTTCVLRFLVLLCAATSAVLDSHDTEIHSTRALCICWAAHFVEKLSLSLMSCRTLWCKCWHAPITRPYA